MAFACSNGNHFKDIHSLQETTDRRVSRGGRYGPLNMHAWKNFPGKTVKKVHFTRNGESPRCTVHRDEIICFFLAALGRTPSTSNAKWMGIFVFGVVSLQACSWWIKAGKQNKYLVLAVTRFAPDLQTQDCLFLGTLKPNTVDWDIFVDSVGGPYG